MSLCDKNIHEIDKFLSPTESMIFKMRFGFSGDKKTLKQCAELLKVSSTRICHIQQKALRKLGHYRVPDFIKDFVREIRQNQFDKQIKTMEKFNRLPWQQK